jgi:hypothetical protein
MRTCDPKCWELADAWLTDYVFNGGTSLYKPENIRNLAFEIQQCIEDEIERLQDEYSRGTTA